MRRHVIQPLARVVMDRLAQPGEVVHIDQYEQGERLCFRAGACIYRSC